MPPILLAKASGMSSRLAFMWGLDAAKLTTIGSIRATVPVLLTKAPMAEVTAMMRINRRSSLFPASLRMRELSILASPVWKMAPPTTNRPTIIMTTELENPDKASSGVRIWNISRYGAYNEAVFSMVGENGRKALRTKWFRHVRENGLNISKRFFSLHGLTSALRLRGFSADLRAIALHRACRWG